jgi:hypothetical protein
MYWYIYRAFLIGIWIINGQWWTHGAELAFGQHKEKLQQGLFPGRGWEKPWTACNVSFADDGKILKICVCVQLVDIYCVLNNKFSYSQEHDIISCFPRLYFSSNYRLQVTFFSENNYPLGFFLFKNQIELPPCGFEM